MAISHEKVMADLSPERRTTIEAKAQELLEEEMTLRDMRAVQRLTQKRLAELLGIEQDSISRMERRTDMLLSTMISYVEAMGGKLRLIAEFPNRRPYNVKLDDLIEEGSRLRLRRSKMQKQVKTVRKRKPKPNQQTQVTQSRGMK